jgi:hypothetical protein
VWRNEPQGKLVIGGWLEASLPFSTSTKNLGTGGNPKPYRRTTTTRARGTMIPCQACSQMRMSRSQVQRDAHTPRAGGQEPRAKSRGPQAKCQEPRAESRGPRAEGHKPSAKSRGPRWKSERSSPWRSETASNAHTSGATRASTRGEKERQQEPPPRRHNAADCNVRFTRRRCGAGSDTTDAGREGAATRAATPAS